MKRNIQKSIMTSMILVFLMMSNSEILNNSIFTESNPNDTQKPPVISNPHSSDVAGNELYAEQIAINIAGEDTLIQQRYITNDTNIMEKIDLQDPAFRGCSFYLSTSNGIVPDMYPTPLSTNSLNQLTLSYQATSGFIFFDNQSAYDTIQIRKARVIDIFKDTFEMDFILQDPIENPKSGYFYPFIAYYPPWETYINTILGNVPQDGYWQTFDKERILGSTYLNSQHLSSSIIFVKEFDMLMNGFATLSADQIESTFDLSLLSYVNQLSTLTTAASDSGILELLGATSGNNTVGNETTNNDSTNGLAGMDLEGMISGFVDQMTNIVITSIQYEAPANSISYKGNNSYQFDLFKALNYDGTELLASQVSFLSIIGALLSGITVSLYSAEVTEMNPERVFLSDYNLNRIEMLLSVTQQDFDISTLKQYSLRIGWMSEEFISQLIVIPENLQNSSDPVNYLSLIGSIGLPLLLGAIINPLENMQFTYKLLLEEPYLQMTKTVDNAGKIVGRTPQLTTVVKNIGKYDAWGTQLNLSMLGVVNDPRTNLLTANVWNQFVQPSLIQALEDRGHPWEDLFPNVNGRFFLVDTTGSGIPDAIFPNILDIQNAADIGRFGPYSIPFTEIILDDPTTYQSYFTGGMFGLNTVTALLQGTEDSVFNSVNWALHPNENFTIITDITDTTSMDTFTTFYRTNLTQVPNISPIVSYGSVKTGIANDTLKSDNQCWEITAQNEDETYLVQEYLTFANSSTIQFEDKSIDALNFILNVSMSLNTTNINVEIYNYTGMTGEEFVSIPNIAQYFVNNTLNLTISDIDYDLADFMNIARNYSILIRLTFENTEAFDIAIDWMYIGLMDRNQNILRSNAGTVYYGTELGVNQYTSRSNSMILGTDDCSSITGYATINKVHSYAGEINYINFTISNVGNMNATNISLTVNQPGIIFGLTNPIEISDENGLRTQMTAGNFTLDQGILNFSIPFLQAGANMTNIVFGFYTPNSRSISNMRITWEDWKDRVQNDTDYASITNALYVSAPITYFNETVKPFVHQIEVKYLSDFTQSAPKTNDFFTVTMAIHLLSNITMYDIHLRLPANTSGLIIQNQTTNARIPSLTSNQTVVFNLNYQKVGYQGYCLPIPLTIEGIEPLITQVIPRAPLTIGTFNISLNKVIECCDTIEGTKFNITVTLTNNGNIEIGNFTIDDIWSYDARGFTLVRGLMVKHVESLQPGESTSITYEIVALSKGYYNISAAQMVYYFELEHLETSQEYRIKVREPYWKLTLRVTIPLVLGLALIYFTYHSKMKYNREDLELERRELLMFGQSFREIAWTKKTLREFLEEEEKQNEVPIPGKEIEVSNEKTSETKSNLGGNDK